MRKQCKSLLLILCCALYMCGISVYAAGDRIPNTTKIAPYTLYIENSKSEISISSGKATVFSHVEGRADVTKMKITAKLQKFIP